MPLTSGTNILTSTAGEKPGCPGCKPSGEPNIALGFAFQPIVDTHSRSVYAYEALVRGPSGESAQSVLSQVDEQNRYQFDQLCRTTAIAEAAALGVPGYLSINFMPNAVYRAEACIRSTFAAAEKHGFPIERIIFETLESESIVSRAHLVDIFKAYRKFGFQTAIDDFGAGYSGLSLLVDFQPDLVKLDMGLIRGIDTDTVRQHVVRGVLTMCANIGIRVIAEGVETQGERDFLRAYGVSLMQGYFFAKPAFRELPVVPTIAFDK